MRVGIDKGTDGALGPIFETAPLSTSLHLSGTLRLTSAVRTGQQLAILGIHWRLMCKNGLLIASFMTILSSLPTRTATLQRNDVTS
jgi:hypothetical protein